MLGETVRGIGAAGVTAGLYDLFGPTQVIETPVSENGFFGAALGLALSGFTPIVEIYSADFLFAVANEIINDMPKWRHQQPRSRPISVTVRGCMGANGGLGPEHSQCMEHYLHHTPGLTVMCPGTPADAAGLLRSAIRFPGPVIFLEHRRVYDLIGEVPDDPDFVVAIGRGTVIHSGNDITLVAWAWMRQEAERAAHVLSLEGISVEVIDPRTIVPLDFDLIINSVHRTGGLVIVEEAPMNGSIGGEIIARVAEASQGRRIRASRVAMTRSIHPYSSSMEREVLPNSEAIAAKIRTMVSTERQQSAKSEGYSSDRSRDRIPPRE